MTLDHRPPHNARRARNPLISLIAGSTLLLAACTAPGANPGEPGSVTVHVGGSMTSFAATSSSR